MHRHAKQGHRRYFRSRNENSNTEALKSFAIDCQLTSQLGSDPFPIVSPCKHCPIFDCQNSPNGSGCEQDEKLFKIWFIANNALKPAKRQAWITSIRINRKLMRIRDEIRQLVFVQRNFTGLHNLQLLNTTNSAIPIGIFYAIWCTAKIWLTDMG